MGWPLGLEGLALHHDGRSRWSTASDHPHLFTKSIEWSLKAFLMETNYHNAHNLSIIKKISIMNKLRLLRLLVLGKKTFRSN